MIQIIFQREKFRAVALDGNREVGEVTFQDRGPTWVIDHTFVDKAYGGQGIAKALVNTVVEEAEKECVRPDATCSYAVKVLGL